MANITDITGGSIPFFVDDYNYEVSTATFDPVTTLYDANHVNPTQMAEQHAVALYERNGFLARPNADGAFFAVTWRQYQNAINKQMTYAQRMVILATLIPKRFDALAGEWIECRLIKVYGTGGDGGGNYLTIGTAMNIGIIK